MPIYGANLTGYEEVPPVMTPASGNAQFQVSNDYRGLYFTLYLHNITNATQGHIHLGRRGSNGPVVAFLFGSLCKGISLQSAVIQGIIRDTDLTGPMRGQPLSSLLQEMRQSDAYANVHTETHPDGEIRGQIYFLGL